MNCEERDRLLSLLNDAQLEWYEAQGLVGEFAGKEEPSGLTEAEQNAKRAERKFHSTQRSLAEHYTKHRCNVD
jgi:hypothetical protein